MEAYVERSVVKEIMLTPAPEGGELPIKVRVDLAGILAISLERKKPSGGRAVRNYRWLRGRAATTVELN